MSRAGTLTKQIEVAEKSNDGSRHLVLVQWVRRVVQFHERHYGDVKENYDAVFTNSVLPLSERPISFVPVTTKGHLTSPQNVIWPVRSNHTRKETATPQQSWPKGWADETQRLSCKVARNRPTRIRMMCNAAVGCRSSISSSLSEQFQAPDSDKTSWRTQHRRQIPPIPTVRTRFVRKKGLLSCHKQRKSPTPDAYTVSIKSPARKLLLWTKRRSYSEWRILERNES